MHPDVMQKGFYCKLEGFSIKKFSNLVKLGGSIFAILWYNI
jgi:hypothetical protein